MMTKATRDNKVVLSGHESDKVSGSVNQNSGELLKKPSSVVEGAKPSKGRCVDHEDGLIGARLKQGRVDSGLTQADIAAHCQVATQQLLKWEKGVNRIPAKVLFHISMLVNKPLSWFMQDIDTRGDRLHFTETYSDAQSSFVLRAVKLFQQIKDPQNQYKALHILRIFGDEKE